MVKKVRHEEGGIVSECDDVHLGEAWERDLLVLSWEDVEAGAKGWDEGRNVVLHEFAHALDDEDREFNGAPLLPNRAMYKRWARVMKAEYEALQADADEERETVLDDYGTEHPAEFFAVVTEAFFETPVPLRDERPELYDLLKAFYRQDPAEDYDNPT
jgi:Mlc titration factor MtfA (ptsG expression regulator)